MTVNLRTHHLLCQLTYIGKGYSPDFVANYDAIVVRLNAGDDVLVVAGPDDICAPLLGDADPHCRRDSVDMRDAQAAQDLTILLGRPIRPGASMTLDAQLLARMRAAFSGGVTRPACTGCEWSELCTQVAAGDYGGVRIRGAVC